LLDRQRAEVFALISDKLLKWLKALVATRAFFFFVISLEPKVE